MSQGYLSVSLSRYEKDFSALQCADYFFNSFHVPSVSCASCALSHCVFSSLAFRRLPPACGFYWLHLFAKTEINALLFFS